MWGVCAETRDRLAIWATAGLGADNDSRRDDELLRLLDSPGGLGRFNWFAHIVRRQADSLDLIDGASQGCIQRAGLDN